jgi:RNA polymerase sigma-70 factor (ECF subfamily)
VTPNDSLLAQRDNGAELIPSAEDAYALYQAAEKEFNRVYKSLHRELAMYARFKCETKEAAEDVAQTVWMKAHQQRAIARCGGDLRRIAAYLREAVRHQAIDDAVHERSLFERAAAWGRSRLTRVREPEAPYRHALGRDIDAKLEKAIRKLPRRCGEVLIQVRYFDKSYEEVAEELGISVTTVAAHMRTATVRLKNDLAAVGYYDLPDVKGEGKEHTP